MLNGPEPEEVRAGQILEAAWPGITVAHIEDQSNGQPDGDLLQGSEVIGKLEVLRLMDQAVSDSVAAWPDGPQKLDGIDGSWIVMVQSPRIKTKDMKSRQRRRMRPDAVLLRLLKHLEASNTDAWDVYGVGPGYPTHEVEAAVAGIVSASRSGNGPTGTVAVSVAWGWHACPSGNYLVELLNDELSHQDSRLTHHCQKLLAIPSGELHLFVWLTSSRLDAMRAFDWAAPSLDPNLDPRISLWIASELDDRLVVRWSSANGWEQIAQAGTRVT